MTDSGQGSPTSPDEGRGKSVNHHWDVLESPPVDQPAIEPYVPPHDDSSDANEVAVVEQLVGLGWPRLNAWTAVGGGMWGLCFLAFAPWIFFDQGNAAFPDPPRWLVAVTGTLLGLGGLLLVAGGLRNRPGRRSVIRLSSEGIKVTTSTGTMHRIAWSDIAVLRMYRSSLGADDNADSVVHLRWQSLTSGESIDIVLGDGIDTPTLRQAITRHRAVDDYYV